jgi:hypothetical protein
MWQHDRLECFEAVLMSPSHHACLTDDAIGPSDASRNSLGSDWNTVVNYDAGNPDGGQSRGS